MSRFCTNAAPCNVATVFIEVPVVCKHRDEVSLKKNCCELHWKTFSQTDSVFFIRERKQQRVNYSRYRTLGFRLLATK